MLIQKMRNQVKNKSENEKTDNSIEEGKKLKFKEYLSLMKQGKSKVYSLSDNILTTNETEKQQP